MQVVELAVTLVDMPYPVTRRLRVPVAVRLSDLHRVLQAAMGWDNAHLYDFTLGRTHRWAGPGVGSPGDTGSAAKSVLAEVLTALGRRRAFLYTYDMGDNWEHEVAPGKPFLLSSGDEAIALLAAEGACPPEDSGGAPGFAHLLEAAADPAHDGHADVADWLGDALPWNPAADLAALAAKLRRTAAPILRKL